MEKTIALLTLNNFSQKLKNLEFNAISIKEDKGEKHKKELDELFFFLREEQKPFEFSIKNLTSYNLSGKKEELVCSIYKQILKSIKQEKNSNHLVNCFVDFIRADDEINNIDNIFDIAIYLNTTKSSNVFINCLEQYFKNFSNKDIKYINQKIIEFTNTLSVDKRNFKSSIIRFYIKNNIEYQLEKNEDPNQFEINKISFFFDLIKDMNQANKKESTIFFLNNSVNKNNYDIFLKNVDEENKVDIINSIKINQDLFESCPSLKNDFKNLLSINKISEKNIYDSIRDDRGYKINQDLAFYIIEEFGYRKDIKTHVINSVFISRNYDKNKSRLAKFFHQMIENYAVDKNYLDSKQLFLIMKRCSHSGLTQTIKNIYSILYKEDKKKLEDISEYITLETFTMTSYKSKVNFNQDIMFNAQMKSALREILFENLEENMPVRKAKI